MKKIFSIIIFVLPFILWSLFYIFKFDLVVIVPRYLDSSFLILPLSELWRVIVVFFVIQLGNTLLSYLFGDNKIFGKINISFIIIHILIVGYLLIFHFT
ncbi:MAG: hypothetical protein KatS3mg097_187 [Candidatus Parcubacteria bacterium]|nr:MAG: hypothetical protein KatS3mg097_187 [Candidatus Parcubacteria bacterium]